MSSLDCAFPNFSSEPKPKCSGALQCHRGCRKRPEQSGLRQAISEPEEHQESRPQPTEVENVKARRHQVRPENCLFGPLVADVLAHVVRSQGHVALAWRAKSCA